MHNFLFYITNDQINGNIIRLSSEDSHHLTTVLRQTIGDTVKCKSFDRVLYKAEITDIFAQYVTLKITSQEIIPSKVKLNTICFLAIPKPQVIASLIPKLTELDLSVLQPVITNRSFIKKVDNFNTNRYRRITKESMKQCGRSDELIINEPIHFKDLAKAAYLENSNDKVLLFPYEGEEHTSISTVLKEIDIQVDSVMFFIGPEGGVTMKEAQCIMDMGFTSVKISENVLRVENAVLTTHINILSEITK